jgi:eukaryotic-like serine/threonine-protein kinase
LLPLVLLIVVGGSIALAAALVARTQAGDELLARVDEMSLGAAPVGATGARPFDPLGDADENGAQAILAVDGDPSTAWRTETYQSRTFGNLKEGVGLIVALDRDADLDTVSVRSPTQGWTARYYVGDGTAASLDGWGEPVAEQSMAAGTTSIELGGARGRALLVWIVDLGDGAGRVEISDLVVSG